MDETPKLPFFRVISIDYLAYVLVITPITVWGIYLVMYLLGNAPEDGGSVYLLLGAIVTVISLAGLVLRYFRQKRILLEGVEVQGKVMRIFFYRDRGRVDVDYTYEGKDYEAWNSLHRCKATEAMQLGDSVAVRIDPKKPGRAVVAEPYNLDGE